ncbi:MAG TPA: hypothetical protein VF578_15260 [Methylomirabilota bacterium]
MNRRLLLLNAVLVLVSGLFVAALVRELLTPLRLPPPGAPRPTPPAAASGPDAPTAPPVGSGAYLVIVSRNLFSPTRAEGLAASVGAPSAPKPLLHGVVMDGPRSRAYLEDPNAKRIYGYAVGDAVAGGRVQSINGDRVIIARPDGRMEVLLQDPDKPKPEPTPAGTQLQPPAPQPPMMAPAPAPATGGPVPPASAAPTGARAARRALPAATPGSLQ